MNKTGKRSPLLMNLLLPAVILLAVMIGLGVFEYLYAFNSVYDNMEEKQSMVLDSALDVIDNTVTAMETIGSDISNSLILCEKIQGAGVVDMMEAKEALPKPDTGKTLISDYYIYVEKTGHLIGPSDVYMSPKNYYGYYMADGEGGYDAWKDAVLLSHDYDTFKPASDMLFRGKTERMITYSVPFIAGNNFINAGKFIFYIREERLTGLFEPLLDMEGSVLYVTDRRDSVVSRFPADGDWNGAIPEGNEVTVNGADYICHRAKSINGKLNIIILTPRRALKQMTFESISVLLIGMAVTFAAAILFIVIYTLRVNKPLVNIARILEIDRKKNISFGKLDEAITSVTSANKLLSRKIGDNQRLLENMLLENAGGDAESISAVFNKSGAVNALKGERLAFTGVYAKSNMDMEAFIRAMNAVSFDGDSFEVLTKREDCYSVLYIRLTSAENRLTELLNEISASGAEIRFYVGREYGLINRVCYSFQQAWTLKEGDSGKAGPVISVNITKDRYRFSSAERNALRTACQNGDAEAAEEIIETLWKTNYSENGAIGNDMSMLLYARLFDILEEMSDDTASLRFDMPPREALAYFKSRFAAVAGAEKEKKNQTLTGLRKAVVDYLNEHYSQPDLSLSSIADVFGMSESALSMLYKEVLNENYSGYVEKLRVMHANELLRAGKTPVSEIARIVGYEHATSFTRAYKRCMGCTPSEYQAQAREAEGDN